MAPNSHHLIQISIVEEYRIFRFSILLLLYLKKKNNTKNIDDTSLLIQK
jgi:hypothetical protein